MDSDLAGKTRLMLVEDDPSLGFVTTEALKDEGYDVKLVRDGHQAFEVFFAGDFEICVLDVMLPKKDGFTLAREIRQLDSSVPILFLTAKSMQDDKMEGFELGADDYLTKPFEVEELVLRIEAVLKRARRNGVEKNARDIFQIGSFEFSFRSQELRREGEKKKLTKKESELLRLLCIHEGRILEREVALKLIWGNDDYFLGRSMDVFITKLRKYLKEDPDVQIENVHGKGFKLFTELR
jgi:DNA-binding response OmpR family regulator